MCVSGVLVVEVEWGINDGVWVYRGAGVLRLKGVVVVVYVGKGGLVCCS